MSSDLKEVILDVREQILYLQELGVGAFDVKLLGRVESGESRVESRSSRNPPPDVTSNFRSEISNLRTEIPNFRTETAKPVEKRPAGSRLASLPSLSKRPTSAPVRVSEPVGKVETKPKMDEILLKVNADALPPMPEPVETIGQIRAEIGPDCTRCPLAFLGRSKVVNSVGNFNADLMFVGEAPGADEDELGEPFVGRAGRLLTDIIKAMGFARDDVFIGNINRCRPPENRAPAPAESFVCKPFLFREIAVVRPKVIVVLGATAAQNLLETKVPIGKLRGQFHDYLGAKVMPTFHPAYLLRDPHKKREVWDDMQMVMAYLEKG